MNYRKCKISLKRHWKAQEPLRSYNPKMVSPFCPITPKTDSVKNRSLALSRVLLGQPHTRFWVCWKERREGEKGDGREGIDIPANTMSSPHTRVLWTKHLLIECLLVKEADEPTALMGFLYTRVWTSHWDCAPNHMNMVLPFRAQHESASVASWGEWHWAISSELWS